MAKKKTGAPGAAAQKENTRQNGNLQQAFDQAKAALLLKGIAEENTPVLYVRKGLLAQDIVMVESEALKKSDNVTIMQKIKKFFRDQRILR